MTRSTRIFLIGVIIASFTGICTIVARDDHATTHSMQVAVVGTGASDPASADPLDSQPASTNAAVTTFVAASPQTPLTDPDPADATVAGGKPASFWQLDVAYPTSCIPGTAVAPVLSWNAADTDTVAVSVDSPTTVGSDGFFESIGTLTMPNIMCDAASGAVLPTHEYEVDAFGTNHTRMRVILDVHITVSSAVDTGAAASSAT